MAGKSCHGVVRLDQTGAEFAMELDNEQLGRCVAHLNTLTWDSGTASSTLERVSAMLVSICWCIYFCFKLGFAFPLSLFGFSNLLRPFTFPDLEEKKKPFRMTCFTATIEKCVQNLLNQTMAQLQLWTLYEVRRKLWTTMLSWRWMVFPGYWCHSLLWGLTELGTSPRRTAKPVTWSASREVRWPEHHARRWCCQTWNGGRFIATTGG